ncbi:MAG: HlyC/CorC family transporter, partial [Planctomycetes bacterium]|nr:HlyC/CorC family transporter [Planctomycetota bacterium]
MGELWLTVAWCFTVLLFFTSAFFSGSETALMGVNRLRLKGLVDKGDRRAEAIQRLLADPTRLLSGILLGNNFANVTLASLATALAEPVWGDMAPVYVAPILTVLLLIFAEILPKSLASGRVMQVASLTVLPLSLFIRAASPIIKATSWLADLLLKPFRSSEADSEKAVSAEDLVTLARLGHEIGAIGKVTHDILHGLYEFTLSCAQDIMVPRHEMVSMPVAAGSSGFEEIVKKHRHTRIPVWGENEEDILGVLHAKDLVLNRDRLIETADLRNYLHPAVFVPESARLGRVLRQMQESRSELCFVVDEYGGLEGLITLRDIL